MNQYFTVQKKAIFVWKKNSCRGVHLKKNSCTSSERKKKFVQAENSPLRPPAPPHGSSGQNTSQNPKHIAESQNTSGLAFGFWDAFWILGSVFGFWEVVRPITSHRSFPNVNVSLLHQSSHKLYPPQRLPLDSNNGKIESGGESPIKTSCQSVSGLEDYNSLVGYVFNYSVDSTDFRYIQFYR